MEHIRKVIEIAEKLELKNIVSELEKIDFRSKQSDAKIVIPLVGEFSSGKTTLINALTDSKKLETATEPTTATIYDIHFGCERFYAEVITECDEKRVIEDIADLKNKELINSKVVTVFDTSTKVSSSTILVDTPGLSSPDPKHKQTLVTFLPMADAILLVSDVNQQVTRSLSDFVSIMEFSKKPIYLVLTKCDTKTEQEVEDAKKYIEENIKIPVKNIVAVSALENKLDELCVLLQEVQKTKTEIIRQVDGQRYVNCVKFMIEHIEGLMKASGSDKELDDAIFACQDDLKKVERSINRFIETVKSDVEDLERNIHRKFEDFVSSRLNNLAVSKSSNYNAEAISIISNSTSLFLNEYKSGIGDLVRDKIKNLQISEQKLEFVGVENIDLSSFQISDVNCDIDLNSMGHEYDKYIKTGLIVAATVAVVATAGSASAAVVPAGTTAVASAGTAGVVTAVDVLDTVTDVGSIVSNSRTVDKIKDYANTAMTAARTVQSVGSEMCEEKGLLDSLIGTITDDAMGKPQRVRAVRNYVDMTLAPKFKSSLQVVSSDIIKSIRNALLADTSDVLEQKREALNKLKLEKEEKKDAFNQKIETLKDYKSFLLTI
jgi:small GTP-binding protein